MSIFHPALCVTRSRTGLGVPHVCLNPISSLTLLCAVSTANDQFFSWVITVTRAILLSAVNLPHGWDGWAGSPGTAWISAALLQNVILIPARGREPGGFICAAGEVQQKSPGYLLWGRGTGDFDFFISQLESPCSIMSVRLCQKIYWRQDWKADFEVCWLALNFPLKPTAKP